MSDLTERLRHGRTVHEREQMVIDDLRWRGLLDEQEKNIRGAAVAPGDFAKPCKTMKTNEIACNTTAPPERPPEGVPN